MATSIHGRLDGVSPANLAPDSALPLELDALVKSFGAIKAVFGVSLEMRGGECLGLLGPNGAAKSIVIAWRRWVTKEFLFIRDQNLSPFTAMRAVDSAGMRSFWRCKVRSGTVIEPVWNLRPLSLPIFCSSSRAFGLDIRTSMTESVIDLGDNMETIEDVAAPGTVLANEAQIGLPHI